MVVLFRSVYAWFTYALHLECLHDVYFSTKSGALYFVNVVDTDLLHSADFFRVLMKYVDLVTE